MQQMNNKVLASLICGGVSILMALIGSILGGADVSLYCIPSIILGLLGAAVGAIGVVLAMQAKGEGAADNMQMLAFLLGIAGVAFAFIVFVSCSACAGCRACQICNAKRQLNNLANMFGGL